jgi:hypothetical protein
VRIEEAREWLPEIQFEQLELGRRAHGFAEATDSIASRERHKPIVEHGYNRLLRFVTLVHDARVSFRN